jgi:hypothetical protein
MKWDWADARSPVVTPRHFAANSAGVGTLPSCFGFYPVA